MISSGVLAQGSHQTVMVFGNWTRAVTMHILNFVLNTFKLLE